MTNKFKVGDIVLFNSDNFYSNCVQLYNKKTYGKTGFTHVGIIGAVSGSDYLMYEALSDGFVNKIDGADNYYSEKGIIDEVKKGTMKVLRAKAKLVSDKECKDILDSYLGRGYAWTDIFAIVVWMTLHLSIKTSGAKKLICSEAATRFLYDASNKKINFETEFDKTFDLIAPEDINQSTQLTEVKI